MSRRPTALGANIFAGLFTQGVKQAGFDVLAQLEHGTYGVATCKLNHPKLDVRVGRENWMEAEFKGKVDFMFCNPPCAAWSTAGVSGRRGGTWESDSQLPRMRYVHDCVEAGIAVRPKAWCWESVTAAWGSGRTFVLHQAEKWNDAGYHCTVLLQDNQYLGAPQIRQRMFLIAHRHPLVWPKLTEPVTAREALAAAKKRPRSEEPDIYQPKFQPLWGRLWKMSDRYNGYFRATWENEGRGPRKLEGRIPSVMVRRLNLDEPAPVMMAASLRLHPTEARYCNWREWLQLCGLPPTWRTSCSSLDAATQECGRAVLPPVGRWLGRAVLAGMEQPALRTRPNTRVVDLRKPDRPFEAKLFDFGGFTIRLPTPPPIPPLTEPRPRKVGAPRASGGAPRPHGVGRRIRDMLRKGWEAERILGVVRKEFPTSKATKADVAWNRGKLHGRFADEAKS